jgi:hypothetical protein
MTRLADPVLGALLAVLAGTVAAFLLGVFPYPFGLFILVALITGRILYLLGADKPRR